MQLLPNAFRQSVKVTLALLAFSQAASAQVNEEDVNYVIDRYIEAMGGKASLEQIKSIRLSGEVEYANGSKSDITVLKKKPNLVRVTLDTGTIRFTQAYDGETAWFSRQSGKNVFYDRMRGYNARNFIREAPLENILIGNMRNEFFTYLGEEVSIAGQPSYQVIAELPDGSRIIHHIEKETFIERRIVEMDPGGEIISDITPGDFQTYAGVVFATKIIRREGGRLKSTLRLDDIDINLGILNTAFQCPVELPEK